MNKAAIALIVSSMSAMIASGPLHACEGKTTVFEDSFADEQGGWNLNATNARIENSALVISTESKHHWLVFNAVNTLDEGDVCADAVFPAADPTAKAGLIAWASDFENFYLLEIAPNGLVGISRMHHNQWMNVRDGAVDSSVKQGKDQVNTLRIRATKNSLAFFVNGSKIREISGKGPGADWYFGLFGQSDERPTEVIFKTVKVTTVD